MFFCKLNQSLVLWSKFKHACLWKLENMWSRSTLNCLTPTNVKCQFKDSKRMGMDVNGFKTFVKLISKSDSIQYTNTNPNQSLNGTQLRKMKKGWRIIREKHILKHTGI